VILRATSILGGQKENKMMICSITLIRSNARLQRFYYFLVQIRMYF
jgi:hypothetical protein